MATRKEMLREFIRALQKLSIPEAKIKIILESINEKKLEEFHEKQERTQDQATQDQATQASQLARRF